MDPAIEQGVFGKVHYCLLKREAGTFLHPQVILNGTTRLDLSQCGLWSEVIPLTNFLHSRESLPVSGLKLNWMLVLFHHLCAWLTFSKRGSIWSCVSGFLFMRNSLFNCCTYWLRLRSLNLCSRYTNKNDARKILIILRRKGIATVSFLEVRFGVG